MNLSWSVLALALIGAEGQEPSQPKTPSSPITIEIDISGPEMLGSESCRKTATAIAAQSDVSTAKAAAQKSGVVAKLVDYCIERCVDLVIDEAKAAIVAKLTEAPTYAPKPATCTKDAACGAPPAQIPSSTLPMKLPKVAKPRTTNDPEAAEVWPMTLSEAFRIALDNSEVVRVIAFGAQGIPIGGFEPTALKAGTPPNGNQGHSSSIVIARLNADAAVWRFKAEVMAEVRSVEQQYWNLAQAHVQLWAADRAVSLAQEVLKREQAELQTGCGTIADVAEATQRLEQFNLDLVTRTADVITTERQLRNLLGLPPADNRRIIPVTPPTEQLIQYDWDTCLHEMMDEQPDIVQQKTLVRVAELQLLIARNQLLPPLSLNALYQLNGLGQQLDSPFAVMTGGTLKALEPLRSDTDKAAGLNENPENVNDFVSWQTGFTFQMPLGMPSPLANSRQSQYILLRSRAYLKQIEHQTTHSLARFFLEVDANYKQYKTATRMRAAAAQRLDAQRAYYEEGRITIDRFLDAISQYATNVATEAQYKTTYNIALAALAEAKGTLLADRTIVIAEGPHPRKAYVQAAQPQMPVPFAVPASAVILAPGQRIITARPFQWKGTQDLMTMTVAAACGADLPQAVEVPRVVAFSMPPMLSVNNASCCGAKPEATASCCDAKSEPTSSVTKSESSSSSAKSDSAFKVTRAESGSNAAKTNAPARSKTWTFSLSIGGGANPLQIKGTVTETETEQPDHAGH